MLFIATVSYNLLVIALLRRSRSYSIFSPTLFKETAVFGLSWPSNWRIYSAFFRNWLLKVHAIQEAIDSVLNYIAIYVPIGD